MRLVKFDRSQEIPIVDALIFGPRTHERVRLVFDSGAGKTQIDTGLIETIGYSARDAEHLMTVQGPTDDSQEGYVIRVRSLSRFGREFDSLQVGAYDFSNFQHYQIDGLLGFDVIKELHFEMNGPEGTLRIYQDLRRGRRR